MPKPLLPWSEEFLEYNFGAGHPMAPLRLALTHQLLADLGVLDDFAVEPVTEATEVELLRVHEADYLAAVRAAGHGVADPARGLGAEDNPIFGQIHEAGARIAGATLAAALAVWEGRAPRALSLAGGMHHAMADRASGFCVFNDVAVAIAALLDAGAQRVAYVDLDAHHGDGVERIFWDDPRVLTVSVHQHPGTLFPGTGYAQDIGGPQARGTAVNVALQPETGDGAWLRVLDAVVPPLLEEFEPQILITQHGCDSHPLDPLAQLAVSVAGSPPVAGATRSSPSYRGCGRTWPPWWRGGRWASTPLSRRCGAAGWERSSTARSPRGSPTASVTTFVRGREGTTPTTRSIARSWPPAARCSRTTGWIRSCAEIRRRFPKKGARL